MTDSHIVACPHCNTLNRIPLSKDSTAAHCGKCKKSVFTGRPLNLNQTNFAAHVNKSTLPILVDFWAEWCGPCKMMAPVIEQVAPRLEPSMRVAKLDTERESQLAMQFGIRSIPTLIVFKQGKEISRQSGAMNAQQLISWLQQFK